MTEENSKCRCKCKRLRAVVLAALVIAIALAAYYAFRKRGIGPVQQPQEEPRVESRMDDAVYRAALAEQQSAQRDILIEKARIDAELADVLKSDPEGVSEQAQALKAQLEKTIEDFKANRERSMAIVRQKMLDEANGINNRTPKDGKGNE